MRGTMARRPRTTPIRVTPSSQSQSASGAMKVSKQPDAAGAYVKFMAHLGADAVRCPRMPAPAVHQVNARRLYYGAILAA